MARIRFCKIPIQYSNLRRCCHELPQRHPWAHNAGSFWPRRGFRKKPGTIHVVIGPTIHTRGKSAEEINKRAEEWIEGKMGEIEKRDSAA